MRCQFVGINALIYYAPTLFGTFGFDTNMQLIMSGVLNVLQLVGVTTSVWTMDTLGRRKLLIIGAVLMAIAHIIIAAMVGIYSDNWPAHQTQGWVSAAFLLFYMIAFGASWGPVPWALPSEIFPSSLRAKGVALSTCSNWLNNFIIVSTTYSTFSAHRMQVLTNLSYRDLLLRLSSKTRVTVHTFSSQSSVSSLVFGHISLFRKPWAEHLSKWIMSSRIIRMKLSVRFEGLLNLKSSALSAMVFECLVDYIVCICSMIASRIMNYNLNTRLLPSRY